jgi:MFS family permease
MMLDLFGASLAALVTAGFATTFVQMMSVANMGGRFAWASASDYLGRQRTYLIFFTLGMLLYASIPLISKQSNVLPPSVWLVLFYGVVLFIMTMYGGGFATIPAYLADLFGSKFVGGIHGRLLTAWSTAGVVGPLAMAKLREASRRNAIEDLAGKVDPAAFQQQFGAGVDQLPLLIEKKTVTIPKLMAIAPPGTPDPTATLYNSTMYLMVALLAVAFIANWFVRPVKAEHYLKEESK